MMGHSGQRAAPGGAMGLLKGHTTLVKGHINRKLHKCSHCPFTTHCITNYKRHISAHMRDKPYAAISALTDLIQMI